MIILPLQFCSLLLVNNEMLHQRVAYVTFIYNLLAASVMRSFLGEGCGPGHKILPSV